MLLLLSSLSTFLGGEPGRQSDHEARSETTEVYFTIQHTENGGGRQREMKGKGKWWNDSWHERKRCG